MIIWIITISYLLTDIHLVTDGIYLFKKQTKQNKSIYKQNNWLLYNWHAAAMNYYS